MTVSLKKLSWLLVILFPILNIFGLNNIIFFPFVCMVIIFWIFARAKRIERNFFILLMPIMLFYCFFWLSLFHPYDLFSSVKSLINWGLLLLLSAITARYGHYDPTSIIKASILNICISTFFFVIFFLIYGGVKFSPKFFEVFGFFSPSITAAIISAIPYVVYGYLRKIINITQFSLLTVFVLIVAVIGANRASILIFIAMAMTYIASKSFTLKSFVTPAIMGFFLIVVFFLMISFIPKLHDSFAMVSRRITETALLKLNPKDMNISHVDINSDVPDELRVMMFVLAISIIKKDFIMGIGFHNFKPFMESKLGEGILSHNLIVTAWAEGGIFPFITLILMVFLAYYRTLPQYFNARKKSERKFYFAAVLSSLTVSLVHSMVQPEEYNLFFLFTLALALLSPMSRSSKL
jgi:hypothetical protein